MVHTGKPKRGEAAHAVPADGDVDLGVLQHVAHVERSGDVGRRNDERKYRFAGFIARVINAGFHPPLSPMGLEPLGFVHFF